MCTAINFLNQQAENVFGRTNGFHYILDPRLAVFPAGSTWENTLGRQLPLTGTRSRDQPPLQKSLCPV